MPGEYIIGTPHTPLQQKKGWGKDMKGEINQYFHMAVKLCNKT